MRRVSRIVCAALSALVGACGGSRVGGTVDTQELARNATPEGSDVETPSAFARRLASTFEENPCQVGELLRSRPSRFDARVEQEFGRFASIAGALCSAEVGGVRLEFDATGELELRHEGAGAIVADDRILVLDVFSGLEASVPAARELRYPACGGFFGDAADYEIVMAEPTPVTMEIADPKAVLLVVTASGQEICGSSSASGGSMVNLTGETGTHQVWVGATSESHDGLVITMASGSSSGSRWVWQEGTTTTFPVQVAGAQIEAYSLSPNCTGYLMDTPTLEVWIPDGRYDYVSATTQGDAVIVAQGPNGEIQCNDDYSGLDPGLDVWFEPGAWTFWVGAYSMGTDLSGTITFN